MSKKDEKPSYLVTIPQVRINTNKKRHQKIDDALNLMTDKLDSKADAIREMLLIAADSILGGVAEKPTIEVSEAVIEPKIEVVKKPKGKSFSDIGKV